MRSVPVSRLLLALCLAASPLFAQYPEQDLSQAEASAEPDADAKPEMKDYQLVLLSVDTDRRDPPEVLDAEDSPLRAQRIERGRQFHMQKLLRSGAALIGGDILDGVTLKTVLIMDLDDTAQVQRLFEESPGVQNGKLKVETFVWWAQEGILRPGAQPEDLVTIWLGLFERPSGAPHFPPDVLERMQAEHIANIERMAASGDLIIAGPVENGDDLRGVLIFRTPDKARIEQLVSADPMVKEGRLVLELYRWQVPRQSLPEAP